MIRFPKIRTHSFALLQMVMVFSLGRAEASNTSLLMLPAKQIGPAGLSMVLTNLLPSGTFNDRFVHAETSQGAFTLQLLRDDAPATVANFLGYVNSGAYRNLIIHRSVPDFVIQTGGYTLDRYSVTPELVPTNSPVANEFKTNNSNVRGTVAMAKVEGDPDSATSQWFVNLADNNTTNNNRNNLDKDNGGFTVFAKVLPEGMSNVDRIAGLTTYDARSLYGGAFGQLPLHNYNPIEGLLPENYATIRSMDKMPCAVSSDPAAFTAQVVGNRVHIDFRAYPSNPVTVSVLARDTNTSPISLVFPVTPPASQDYFGLLRKTNGTTVGRLKLSLGSTGIFSGQLVTSKGTAAFSSSTLGRKFDLADPSKGILFQALGESLILWYDHKGATVQALNYSFTNTNSVPPYVFRSTLIGSLLPTACTGAKDDVSPLATKAFNALLIQTNTDAVWTTVGYLRFTFDKAGNASIAGRLPDDRSVSSSTRVVSDDSSAANYLPVGIFQGGSNPSSLTGNLAVLHTANASEIDIAGSLSWSNGTNATSFQVFGSRWMVSKGTNALTGTNGATNFTVRFDTNRSVLASAVDHTGNWPDSNIPKMATSTTGITFSFVPATGLFSGYVPVPAVGGKTNRIVYRGLMLSKPISLSSGKVHGGGYFCGTNGFAIVQVIAP